MNKKFGALKENLGKIQRHLEEQSNNNDIIFENKLKDINNLEIKIAQGLD